MAPSPRHSLPDSDAERPRSPLPRLGILASRIGVALAIAINSALAFLTIAPTAIALARLGPRRETAAA